jgi:FkbM family methyltransferase
MEEIMTNQLLSKWSIRRITRHIGVNRGTIWNTLKKAPFEVPIVANTEHGLMCFSSRDEVIGRYLFSYRQFEIEKIRRAFGWLVAFGFLDRLSTRTLVDVGANIGTVCIYAIRDGYFSRAIALEPEPRNYRLLRRNIALNRMRHKIQAHNVGASDKAGSMTLALSADNFGDHRISEAHSSNRQDVSIQVETLDQVLEEAKDRVGLVWMDVQGHEWHALRGAQSLIENKVPFVIEFSPEFLAAAGVTPEAFSQNLKASFCAFYDLAEVAAVKKNISEIPWLFGKYSGPESFTDLILIPR